MKLSPEKKMDRAQACRLLPGLVSGLFSLLLFGWFLTYGTFRIWEAESFGNFYDEQAVSLLEGRLDVPPHCIGNEAFVYGGKTYGYFGLTPAILRLPFVVSGIGKNKLSRTFMLLYFSLALLASVEVLRQAFKLADGPAAEPPGWSIACLLLASGPGSTFLLLGSRSFIFHEAILCGASFALASTAFSLRWLRSPASANWVGAVGCGLMAVQGRPPSGLFALTLAGLVAARLLYQAFRGSGEAGCVRRPLVAGLLCIPCVLSFNTLSFLKFSTWEGCPLRYALQYPPERLEMVGHASFHLRNIPHNLDAYFTGVHVSPKAGFPFFETEHPDLTRGKTAFVEPGKPISIPIAMPALSLLSLAGALAIFHGPPGLRWASVLSWSAMLPMTLALCAAIAVSQRHTADFIPFLVLASSLGLANCDRGNGTGTALKTTFWTATIISVCFSNLITLRYQGTREWGVPSEVPARYQALQRKTDEWLGIRTSQE